MKEIVFTKAVNLSKAIIPYRHRMFIRKILGMAALSDDDFVGCTNREIFSRTYEKKLWGWSGTRKYYSGHGSHEREVVTGYVNALEHFLVGLAGPKIIVDLGCGDFNVGSRLVHLASKYIACDIVDGLLKENRKLFKYDNLEFKELDLVNDEIPMSDVIIVRQVLQHLSNNDIHKFIDKIHHRCKYLIVTEHLPIRSDFLPNIDKPSGPGFRVSFESGVILTEPPFNLLVLNSQVLCEFKERDGIIRTFAYRLQ
ncbi:class I SAM-dependent methyltransferase [Microvirga aerophila]|uniref:class I SAM-dependent methyltransferase n=2 Tax=Microvirga aerophila TaxID=670291 RepID=UPI0013B470C8|nr:class I SAM-dependent methyltransferase [Microvirga aerophila]